MRCRPGGSDALACVPWASQEALHNVPPICPARCSGGPCPLLQQGLRFKFRVSSRPPGERLGVRGHACRRRPPRRRRPGPLWARAALLHAFHVAHTALRGRGRAPAAAGRAGARARRRAGAAAAPRAARHGRRLRPRALQAAGGPTACSLRAWQPPSCAPGPAGAQRSRRGPAGKLGSAICKFRCHAGALLCLLP